MSDSISKQYCITSDHPSLAGHFPNDPIVPGVVILDLVNALFQQWQPGKKLTSLAQAKFHLPLRPEQKFTIRLSRLNQFVIKFECLRGQEKLASGQFNFTR